MDEEIQAIEKNDTWVLASLLKGHQAIGVKWGYKTEECTSLYVDDMIFTGNNTSMIIDFKSSMIREFEMTDIGIVTYFLGIKVKQNESNIFISQTNYAKELMKKFSTEACDPVDTPLEAGLKLKKKGEGNDINLIYYKSLIESLRYLTCTRTDMTISYGVGLVSHFMEELMMLQLKDTEEILCSDAVFLRPNRGYNTSLLLDMEELQCTENGKRGTEKGRQKGGAPDPVKRWAHWTGYSTIL
ncbi:uncharacterized protein LOC109838710 [Asparagus officinalis]|uniref:uncharacterized protein LOC109838710 n=1 Tax=Asparagus officinalis TaxID=4686 RepID=UPI00098E55DE|nr:uncharacterized protein LOC109838710 [Asparagus officinalis]